jgi:hypothetical protein
MKKYFYTNGKDQFGPFSLDELKSEELTRETKVWFYGLEEWTVLSKVDELNVITQTIPPELKKIEPFKIQNTTEVNPPKNNINFTEQKNHINDPIPKIKNSDIPTNKTVIIINEKKKKIFRNVLIITISSIALILLYTFVFNNKDKRLYKEIVASSYYTDEDFDIYVDKFYRDIEVYGIFPKKPKVKIVKFAKLDQIDDVTHYHGISYGMNNDDKIEIYINPSSWEKFSKPMRYFLMYHELSHDVLNVDHLENTPLNDEKLMKTTMQSYIPITMDEFIESSHALFEEVSSKK